ncbi:MAG: hypothetical protein R3245_02065 [Kiloniellales bacterium]|nr:hypothetical protein [Kiloniellales bacterium]
MIRNFLMAGVAALTLSGAASAATSGERIQVKGEIIDTWCYLSEVMGSSEAVLGSAHHQCAVWCAAGGVPVGLLAESGELYMVLKVGDDDTSHANPKILEIQSDQVTVDGELFHRDGINYLLIDQVVANEGIVNRSHEDYGVIPAFGVPKQ